MVWRVVQGRDGRLEELKEKQRMVEEQQRLRDHLVARRNRDNQSQPAKPSVSHTVSAPPL